MKFRQKKTDSKTIGELAMRKARIFNYYNKRPHKGTIKIIEQLLYIHKLNVTLFHFGLLVTLLSFDIIESLPSETLFINRLF
jgi:hypothetical protein